MASDPEGGVPVPITAKLSNKFYERLGDEVADAPEEFDSV
jgi:hypothetical protein